MRTTVALLACVWLLGCSPPDEATDPAAPSDGQPEVRDVAANYRKLKLMTPQQVFVDRDLALLCRGATQEEVEARRKISGPHANTAVKIYMNDLAAGTFGKPKPSYPAGSIIVKEKNALGYLSATRPDVMVSANDGVGGMIKRPAGFDPPHGDWEYFYFEDPGKIQRGKIASCVQCHSGAAAKDYVFGKWAAEANRSR